MRLAACVVAVVLAGCECGHADGQLAVVFDDHGTLSTSTVEGDFALGPVASGNTLAQPMVLKNIGCSPITLTRIERVSGEQLSIDAPPAAGQPFRLDGFTDGFELAPSTVKGLELTLTAPATQEPVLDENLTLRVHAQNGSVDQTVLLVVRAEDLGGQCLVDPVLDFGVIPKGTQRTKEIRLGNPTPETLVATVGDVTGDAVLTGPAGGLVELAPSQIVSRSYLFAPTAAGDFSAQVTVKPSAACPTVKVTLRGRAVDGWITAAPSPVEFGHQAVGAAIGQRLTFSNWTMQPVTVSQLSIAGEADFTVADQQLVLPAAQGVPTGTLYPGTRSIDLSFSPKQLGYRTATLGYATDLPAQPQGQVVLEGVGGAPDVEVTPASIDFGQVPFFACTPHGPAGAAVLSIHNRGDAPLHLGTPGWDLTGMQSSDVCVGDFDPQLGCLGTVSGYDPSKGIAPGETLALNVHLVASSGAAGGLPLSWTLDLFTDDPDQPLIVVPLSAQYVVVPPCNFSVTPQLLDFGVVSSPAVATLGVTITNQGSNSTDRCIVTGVQLSAGSGAGFSLPMSAMNGVILAPGQSLSLPVQFTPRPSAQLGQQSGALTFFVSSPTLPFVSVPLTATEGDGCLVLSPLHHDFGSVGLGCGAATHTFTATNTCTSAVTILGGAFASPGDFSAPAPIPANSTLAAGASLTFQLGYHGATFGPQQASFVVTSDEQGGTRMRIISLTGDANLSGYEEDTRVQTAVGQADLLFLIDNSCSMQSLQTTLHDNLATFAQYLVDAHADVQLGVITTDLDSPDQSGKLQASGNNPRVLDSTMSGFVTLAEQNLDVGTNGSGIEHLEGAIVAALSPPASGFNAGLLRPHSAFAVVELSDTAGPPDTTFLPFLRTVNANVTYTAAKPFGSCGSVASAADDLYTAQTGGQKIDLCQSGWGLRLSSVVLPALQLPSRMTLVAVPDLSTGGSITVKVDGVVVPQWVGNGASAWTYDPVGNTITFSGLYLPQAGQTVTFTYPVACGP